MYDKLSFLVRKDAVLKKEEFTQKVAELIELAHKKEDRLTINEIQDFFKDDDLTEKQKTDVITELTGKKINVNMGVDVNEPKAPKLIVQRVMMPIMISRKKARQQLILLQNLQMRILQW